MTTPKIVTLLSGGIDSTTLAYEMDRLGHEVVGLGINYGQRHARELHHAHQVATKLGIGFRVVDLTSVRNLLTASALTSDIAIPHGHYAEDTMKATVVPNRNMIMLAIAAGHAASIGAEAVGTAVHAGDHFIYPDCRPEFIESLNITLRHAMEGLWNVTVVTPFLHLSKTQIVARGAELGVPYELTWSCYEGGARHCGACGTCVERKEAFREAHVSDPTEYSDETGVSR